MAEIQIKRIKTLRGPNIWAYRPVLEILIDIGRYEELPSDRLPGFPERLIQVLPSLYSHRCSEGHPGGFLERLRMGTWMGHILEHVVLELQSLAGMAAGYGRTRSSDREGEYHVVVDYKDAEAACMCVNLGAELLEALAEDRPLPWKLEERLAAVRATGEDNMLGPSTRAIVDAARRRGIPWYRLSRGSLVQLGHGRNQRRIQAAETSLTSNIAVEIASDKDLTKTLLDQAGVPVPHGRVVREAEEALQAARALGGPVVVKPADGNQGRAVSVNLTTDGQILRAFELARSESRDVIIEQYVEGEDYRLLVINGELVAAAVRRPAQVVADGLRTVRQLVEAVNEDPARGNGHCSALTRIRMDAAAELVLSKQQLGWDSVPPTGQVVLLRECSNLSTGGTATDVTDEVHPETAAMAVLAAKTIGLDIAGIDIVCRSIRRPLENQGAVVEVNAAPGLRMHLAPSHGRPRPVGEAIIDMLYPRGTPARIPTVAITGTNGKTTVTRMVGHIFAAAREYVGMATTDGVYFDGVRRIRGDCSGPRSAEAVLQHPLVSAAVLETARGGILRAGLGWDRCTVGVVLNVAADHLGLEGIHTVEQLARVKRVIIEGVSRDGFGILNAEDPLVAGMAEYCQGEIIYFAQDACHPVITAHVAAGHRAVYVREGDLILAEGSDETVLLRLTDIPATWDGLLGFQVCNALAAAAACWGSGVPRHSIRLGLRTFQADEHTAPGRFNLFRLGGARLIVDYGHNAHALAALEPALTSLGAARTIAVLGAPGDRRDEDILNLGAVAARIFDYVILRDDADLRNRRPGETPRLLLDSMTSITGHIQTEIVLDEREAVAHALAMLRDGDLLIVFADALDDILEQVRTAAEDFAHASREGAPAAPAAQGLRMWMGGVDASGPGEEIFPAAVRRPGSLEQDLSPARRAWRDDSSFAHQTGGEGEAGS